MYEFDTVGCLVLRDDKIHQICSSEESAEICANLYRKAQAAEINERTRQTYMAFIARRDNHNTAKVA